MLATGEREQFAQIVFHDRFVADGCLTGQGCANSAITRRGTIPKQLDRRLYVERFRKHRLIGRMGRLQARDDLRRLGKSVDKLCGDRQLHFGPRDVINTSLICKTCAELTSLDWSCWEIDLRKLAEKHARKPLGPRSPVLAAPSHFWNRQPARGFHSSGRARFPPGFERAPGAAAPVQIQQHGAVAFSIQVTTALSRCSVSLLR
jgi:hypothetical protein